MPNKKEKGKVPSGRRQWSEDCAWTPQEERVEKQSIYHQETHRSLQRKRSPPMAIPIRISQSPEKLSPTPSMPILCYTHYTLLTPHPPKQKNKINHQRKRKKKNIKLNRRGVEEYIYIRCDWSVWQEKHPIHLHQMTFQWWNLQTDKSLVSFFLMRMKWKGEEKQKEDFSF